MHGLSSVLHVIWAFESTHNQSVQLWKLWRKYNGIDKKKYEKFVLAKTSGASLR